MSKIITVNIKVREKEEDNGNFIYTHYSRNFDTKLPIQNILNWVTAMGASTNLLNISNYTGSSE